MSLRQTRMFWGTHTLIPHLAWLTLSQLDIVKAPVIGLEPGVFTRIPRSNPRR